MNHTNKNKNKPPQKRTQKLPKTTNLKLNWDHSSENVQSFIIFPISNTYQLQSASVLGSELKPHEVKYQTLCSEKTTKVPETQPSFKEAKLQEVMQSNILLPSLEMCSSLLWKVSSPSMVRVAINFHYEALF